MEHLDHMHYIHASLDLGKILHRVCVLLLTRVVLGAIFLDLRKAFDTVNHQLLISKSVFFSLDTNPIAWIQSNLNDRQQCVTVDNIKS